MARSTARLRRIALVVATAILAVALALVPDVTAMGQDGVRAPTATIGSPPVVARLRSGSTAEWAWPLDGPRRVVRTYQAPPTRYEAGHRGVDLPAVAGTNVLSPADGVIRFAGVVVDRPVVTIETPRGVLVSLEPVVTELRAGDAVTRAQRLGTTTAGGHCGSECLHLGVRVDGDYVSPLRFFGGVPRAVLLPLH